MSGSVLLVGGVQRWDPSHLWHVNVSGQRTEKIWASVTLERFILSILDRSTKRSLLTDNVGSFKVDHRVLDLLPLICLDTADPAALFVLSVLKGRSDWSELRCFHTQEQEVTGQERGHKRTFWFLVHLSTLRVSGGHISVFSHIPELPWKQSMFVSEILFCQPLSGDHRGG